MKKKILIVIDTLASGGAQKLSLNLAKGLIKKSFDVEIFVYETTNDEFNFFNSEFKKLNIKLRTVKTKGNKRFFKKLKIIFELRKLIKSDYNSIISFLHIPSIYSSLAKIGLKKCKLTVCELSSSNAPVKPYIRLMFYIACFLSDNVVANSYSESRRIAKNFFLSNKVHPIWNGFNTQASKYNNLHTIKDISKKILIVARVAYPKNGLNLLKGLNKFLENNNWAPEISWYGRNEIDNRSINMQNEMKKYLLENPKLNHYFKFCGESKDIDSLYMSYDALILPSIYEGLPLVICEAMLSNCFVIASNVCDHPLILGQNTRGLLFEPNSPESIATSLNNFYSLSEKNRSRIINEAKEFANENFAINKMVDSFEKLF